MGTLDPMADGVLPVAAGRAATRMFEVLHRREKEYLAEFTFGFSTDTLDITGGITERGGRIPTENEIAEAVKAQIGRIAQIPPRFSAKSVNGVRAYRMARRGEEFELPPKEVDIYLFELTGRGGTRTEERGGTRTEERGGLHMEECSGGLRADERGGMRTEERLSGIAATPENTFAFRIRCGGGTYIRALARDLGLALNAPCVMSALTRTESCGFSLSDSSTLEELADTWRDRLIPVETVANP
jgi:tRNA pseudouridine55 synthase